MPNLIIDGHKIHVPDESTVLQAIEHLGKEVPIFCYHKRLSVAGNCRMCLVEVASSKKLIASCAMPAQEGMVINTDTTQVRDARKGNLEFLLINHPLDCPICDQGGECDLQDITMAYGSDRGHFDFPKRSVADKNFGPLIKTSMNRCIHCTRCVRFATEIAGVPEIGTIGRGENMQITSYLERTLSSELSGNLVDLCPVGALTSKPYAFRGRVWELKSTESIDVMDAVGCNIRIDTRGREVMRILPRLNESINEEWISDKTRFSYDGLKSQRLDQCYVRNKDSHLVPATWHEAFQAIYEKFKTIPGDEIAGIVGDQVDCEAMIAFKQLMQELHVESLDCRQDQAKIGPSLSYFNSNRGSYLFNTSISGIEKADFCLLIGTNPRYEAPIINARLRKVYVHTGLEVSSIGPKVDLTYPVTFYGENLSILHEIIQNKDHPLSQSIQKAKFPLIILGQGALRREDGAIILKIVQNLSLAYGVIRSNWNGFNVLHMAASRVGGLDLGLVPGPNGLNTKGIIKGCSSGKIKALYLLAADELPSEALEKPFLIYQGHHGDRGASYADVILPGAAYTEKDGIYVNLEGRVQEGYRSCFPPGEALEDWRILKNLSDFLAQQETPLIKKSLPYETQQDIRHRLQQENRIFNLQHNTQQDLCEVSFEKMCEPFGEDGAILHTPLSYPIENFYTTDPISRNSINMAKCTQELKHKPLFKEEEPYVESNI